MGDTAERSTNEIDVVRRQFKALTPEFANALPKHIPAEKFERVAMTVFGMNPELLSADRRSLLAACMKCAADGLVPDGREAALVMFGKKVQYMPMFAGIQKRVRNSGEVSSIDAQVIYANDEFVWHQGTERKLEHKPKFPGDRGPVIGAYSTAQFKDGSPPQFEVMDLAQLEKVRAISKTGAAGPWKQWTEEMYRKTVFKRFSKWLPSGADMADVLARDDQVGMEGLTDKQAITIEGTVAASPSVHQIGQSDRLAALELMGQADPVTIDGEAA